MSISLPSASANAPPKVTVMVRTIGRAALSEAIASVVEQTFTDWELLIVNASAQPHPALDALPEQLGARLTLLQPGTPLGRAAAANALLDAARGEYAIFLDDDDWWLPEHLQNLVSTLDSEARLGAAYSDVRTTTQPPHIFASDFDLDRLQFENYLPIHSVLFRRSVAELPPACRFDESLALFEDWDFWLQLATRAHFQRVPGVSAVYALDQNAGSGHADASGDRASMLRHLAERQLGRWTPEHLHSAMDRFAALMHAERQATQEREAFQRHNAELAAALDRFTSDGWVALADFKRLEAALERVEADRQTAEAALSAHRQEVRRLVEARAEQMEELKALSRQLAASRHAVQALHASRSWRLTAPLRWTGAQFRRLRIHRALRAFRGGLQAAGPLVRRYGVVGLLRRVPYYLRQWDRYASRLAANHPPAASTSFRVPERPAERELRLHPNLLPSVEAIDHSVSVVIPTLNAGPEFPLLLRKLKAQRAVGAVEIVIVDSGSRDGTVEVARALGCKLIEIPPEDFSHSHARNLGAENASGDYLLIMVQDAYPIGDLWMHGMLRFLLDHADEGLVAASCAEYSRSDSDMMYDSMIHTHYRFLGCLDQDRIGSFHGDDHMALRSWGQLSDVSCMIARERFAQYRYRGDYAEDLDLGIRLIKDGYKVAMLASVKVIHSHNRPAYYYLKRTFVDVIFLVGMFDDFLYPPCESSQGLIAGIVWTASSVRDWLDRLDSTPVLPLSDELRQGIEALRSNVDRRVCVDAPALEMGDARLDAFVRSLLQRIDGPDALDAVARDEARRFRESFIARLEHFQQFAAEVYGPQDALLRQELRDVVRKTFAAAAGGALAFFYLDRQDCRSGADRELADTVFRELKAGV